MKKKQNGMNASLRLPKIKMSEQGPESAKGVVSRVIEKLQLRRNWFGNFALHLDRSLERRGNVVQRKDLVPLFLEDKALNEMLNHWRQHRGNEVGGWLIGEEGEFQGHHYLRVIKALPDRGRGTWGEFSFEGPFEAFNYVKQVSREGQNLAVIGTWHTHPKDWSGRITHGDRDSHVFSVYESTMKGEWSSAKSAHVVLTPADNNAIDIWEIADGKAAFAERLKQSGCLILRNKATSRVKVIR